MSLHEHTRPGLGIDRARVCHRQRRLGTMTRFVLLLMFLLAASTTKAQIPQTSSLTGSWLYTVCGANDQSGQTICQMWIRGFQAGIISSQDLAQVNKLKPASCIPHDLTADQAKLTIENFLKDNPQYMQLSAETVATYALVIAFPCR
jgi:Rap1a immunity proteins